ncbi:MAG: hydroxysqualene dehydroxylase HpnE [Hyphomicrobiales bacterium]
MSGTVHIVGLGVAGLSAAVRLADAGREVKLYDGAKVAGGRCRSFHDAKLDCLIDNGNHLLLSGNKSALSYLDLLGARHELEIADEATFPFYDHESKERWAVTLDKGLIPWWVFQKSRSIPGVRLSEFASALKFPFASAKATIESLTGKTGKLFERFWEPMTWAVLNTTPDRASAKLMWAVFAETFAKGGTYCKPMIAKRGLSETFVDPALTFLETKDVEPQFNIPLKEIETNNGLVTSLHLGDDVITLGKQDSVVLAVPRAQAARLASDSSIPDGDTAIVNAHFKMADGWSADNAPPLLGLVNSKTHWIFTRGNIISLTISAADALGLDRLSEDELLPQLWDEVVAALDLPTNTSYEAGRLIRERRATFDQSPESVAKRPDTKTDLANLCLAGDWTNTGVPATIEGSIRSGELAAEAVLSWR